MSVFKKNRSKIFCIGLNKTGTTTIKKCFEDFNYRIGDQRAAEHLVMDWYERDFKALLKYCKKYQAFQDAPFSLPYTFIVLDQHFPDAKFILTVRDSSEQWYNSLTRFHSKMWADGERIPTREDLEQAPYLYKGYAYEVNRALFHTPENDLYNKEILFDYYETHTKNVNEYFRSRPDKLLEINVSKKQDYIRLCDFLGKSPQRDDFTWENKT